MQENYFDFDDYDDECDDDDYVYPPCMDEDGYYGDESLDDDYFDY